MEKRTNPSVFNTPINYLKASQHGNLQLQLPIRRKRKKGGSV